MNQYQLAHPLFECSLNQKKTFSALRIAIGAWPNAGVVEEILSEIRLLDLSGERLLRLLSDDNEEVRKVAEELGEEPPRSR